jgi:hypothetical protein
MKHLQTSQYKSKSIMVATSRNKGKINPMIVGPNEGGSGSAAEGSVEPGGKKAAYKPKVVPGWDSVNLNSARRRWPAKKGCSAQGGCRGWIS